MFGNTISVAAYKRLWIAIRKAQGCHHQDPWANGTKQAELITGATHDKLSPDRTNRLNYLASPPRRPYHAGVTGRANIIQNPPITDEPWEK